MDSLKLEDVKQTMAASSGVCVTLILPTQPANGDQRRQDPIRFKNAVKEVERQLAALGLDQAAVDEVAGPIRELFDGNEAFNGEGGGIAVFRSTDSMRVLPLPTVPQEEIIMVAENFHVKPLLQMIGREHEFFLLGLSRKHVRLLRCTSHESHEVPLPDGFPVSMEPAIYLDTPDHNLAGHSGQANGSGERSGAHFGTGTEETPVKEYMAEFFARVAKALNPILRGQTLPLVVACVDYEFPIWKQANSYRYMLDEHVHGSPDGLKGGEMHARALEIAERARQGRMEQALAEYDRVKGTEKASDDLHDVLRAAHQGKVLNLFVVDGAMLYGQYDDMAYQADVHPEKQDGDEDLFNLATIQTVLHAGEVFTVPAGAIPGGTSLAAVYRY